MFPWPSFLPNPWLILAAVLAIGTAYVSGDLRGAKRGADGVQVRWDKENAQRALRSAENEQRGRDTQEKLQNEADKDRAANAQTLAALDRRVRDLSDELSKRPQRPASTDRGAPAAGAGTDRGTGLGLYREDALFLIGEAATAKRIKLQRDQCYIQYERAAAEIEALKKEKGPQAPP